MIRLFLLFIKEDEPHFSIDICEITDIIRFNIYQAGSIYSLDAFDIFFIAVLSILDLNNLEFFRRVVNELMPVGYDNGDEVTFLQRFSYSIV